MRFLTFGGILGAVDYVSRCSHVQMVPKQGSHNIDMFIPGLQKYLILGPWESDQDANGAQDLRGSSLKYRVFKRIPLKTDHVCAQPSSSVTTNSINFF